MKRSTGYLANIINTPPLIFRFQFNPELLSEKKSWSYREVNTFGKWKFDRAESASSAFASFLGGLDDLKEWGSLLVGTKALESDSGGQRTFALDFALDARELAGEAVPGEEAMGTDRNALLIEGDKRVGGRIEPDLAVLRSFMNPAWDPVDDFLAWISGAKQFCPPTRPPLCTLKLGGIDLDCVMTDLNIKITQFKPDLTPLRAEVSVSLKEQTFSFGTTVDYIGRLVEVAKSYGNLRGEDWVQALPAAGMVQNVLEL